MESIFIPTQITKLNRVVEPLVVGIKAILGDKFLGAYLGGSFAHGGWDIYSDVDFDIVIASDLTPKELGELKVHHASVFLIDSYWARHLEGAYFPVDILSDLDRTDQPIWYLDNGSLNFELSLHDNTLVNRWVLREKGIVLSGPDPKKWIPSIPSGRLKEEIRSTMIDWWGEISGGSYKLDNRWAQTFAVLMYCRMLHSLETGEIGSKPLGAAWAKANLHPNWGGLIDDALSARPNQYDKYYQPSDSEKVSMTHDFIEYAIRWSSDKF